MTDTLLARHSLADHVAYGSNGERTAADLLRDAAAVAHALPEKVVGRSLVLLGVRRDTYACIAALLGAWERGYEVLVPPADATREGFLRMAQRPDVAAVVHDTASSAGLPIAALLANATPERRLSDAGCVQHGVLQLAALEANEGAAALRLEGSQLLREAALLGRSLELPAGAAYASCLLESTRYAWAAGVFWPLLSGGCVLRDDPREPAWAAHLAGRVPVRGPRRDAAREFGRAQSAGRAAQRDAARDSDGSERVSRAVVIAAPAQLRLLTRRSPSVLERGQRVVSLGAPLPAAAFTRLHAAGLVVSDVYATDQLGCLGQRSAPEQAFWPLLELSLQGRSDAALQLTAPHIAAGRGTEIHAKVAAEGGFIATGVTTERAEWEERIAWIEGVHDAALLALNTPRSWHLALSLDAAAPAVAAIKARIATELPALELSELRRYQLQETTPSVSSFASGRCDLSRNGAGRHDRVSLLRLFGRAADATALSWDLVVEPEQIGPERAARHVQVPANYGYFAGHFPGYPLLPGAAQLSELVVPFVRAVRPELGRLTRMARLKFQERIVPNDRIEVGLTFGPFGNDTAATERSVEFSLRRGESLCATGRLWFEVAS